MPLTTSITGSVTRARGGVRDRRQPVRQLGARLSLDRVHEVRHDIIENADPIL
jgi:hypothetical protein